MRTVGILRFVAVFFTSGVLLSAAGVVTPTSAAPQIRSPEEFSNPNSAPTAVPPVDPSGITPRPCQPTDCNGDFAVSVLDVNGDCTVTDLDAEKVAEFLTLHPGTTPVTPETRNLDVDGDGSVTQHDEASLLFYLYKNSCLDTPTPTPTPTATVTQTATAVPPCEFVKSNLSMLRYEATGAVKDVFSGMTQGSSCVSSMIDALKLCVGHKVGGYRDDHYALCFAKLYMNGRDSKVGDLGKGAYCNRVTVTPKDKDWIDPTTKADSYWHHFSGDIWARFCLDGYLYLRKEPDPATGSCRTTGKPADPAVCGEFSVSYIKSSPISLLWEPGVRIDDSISVVRFPIEPSRANDFVGWKGSAKTPLLVYDPRHSGSITQASQLFGNWTFGGKQLASLSTSAVGDTAWANGFEALATLDLDGNGKVDKGELAPLALWFDRDQDGVSDRGEVIPVNDLGVIALYYQATDPSSGRDIHVSLGFERIQDGRVVKGGAVDWYGGHAESKFEVIGHQLLGKPGAPSGRMTKPSRVDRVAPKTHGALSGRNPFAGLWAWKFDESSSEPPGHLILSGAEGDPNVVQGYSLVTMPFAKAPEPELGSLVNFYFVKGDRSVDGKVQKIVFRSDFGKSRTENEATLSADGISMTGKTKAFIAENGTVREVTYTWSAQKISER